MLLTSREKQLLVLIDEVISSADNEGCTDDLTVIDAAALDSLAAFVELMRQAIAIQSK